MRRFGLLLALLCGVSLGRAAPADESEIIDDVRCIYVGIQAVQSDDPAVQQSAIVVSMYFLGRLEVIAPHADLEELLFKESPAMSKTSVFKTEASRCSLTMKDKGKLMQQVGTHLVLRHRDPAEPKSSDLP
jgi:hypothetical protein